LFSFYYFYLGRHCLRCLLGGAATDSITQALIVTGWSTSLQIWTFLGDFLGSTVDDEIRAWNLTPHSAFGSPRTFGRGSANPLLGVWVWISWTLLPASPFSDPRRLHTLFSPVNHSPFPPLSQFPSHSDADLTTNQDQEPKTKHD
jgi:hypothetical protein